MIYKITSTNIDWVEADSEEEAREKWLDDDTVGCAEAEVDIEIDNEFYEEG